MQTKPFSKVVEQISKKGIKKTLKKTNSFHKHAYDLRTRVTKTAPKDVRKAVQAELMIAKTVTPSTVKSRATVMKNMVKVKQQILKRGVIKEVAGGARPLRKATKGR
ncbi:hypothetical protein HK101_003821 [Irineochytrium annulatum]|nr:hypothetical protein HK101_003821 [Irineochytrium annulatum]